MELPVFKLSVFWPQLSVVPVGTGGIGTCCATGSLHTGTPTGTEEKLYGLNTYVAKPAGTSQPKGVVVIIPDIFGWTLPNNRILADEMAKKGPFIVLLPDFMDGYVVPLSILTSFKALQAQGLVATLKKVFHILSLMYWMIPFTFWNGDGTVRGRIGSYLRGVREEHPNLPVGAAGYCWGGKYTIELCSGNSMFKALNDNSDTKPLVVCGFTAHPSRLSYPSDIEAVNLPLSIAASGKNDPMMSKEQGDQTEKNLERKTEEAAAAAKEGIKSKHEFVWYPAAQHGFAVRADEDDKDEAERGKQAEAQAVDWFSRWFDDARSKKIQ